MEEMNEVKKRTDEMGSGGRGGVLTHRIFLLAVCVGKGVERREWMR